MAVSVGRQEKTTMAQIVEIGSQTNLNQKRLMNELYQLVEKYIEESEISLVDLVGALEVVKWTYITDTMEPTND